jgi:hypothetical protein
MRTGAVRGQAGQAARQLLEVIGRSIERPKIPSSMPPFAASAAIA